MIKHIETCRSDKNIGRDPEEGYERFRPIWVIVADLEDGRQFTHNHDFNTPEEANRLIEKIQTKGTINLEHWSETTPKSWEELELEWTQIGIRERTGMPL